MKIPKIPQNSIEIFQFEKNDSFFAIHILLNFRHKINFLNLFLIFKTYLLDKSFLLKFVHIIASHIIYEENPNKELIILRNINVDKLEKMSFIDFRNWYQENFSYDEIYLTNYKYYGFQFGFFKESLKWEQNEIYPRYPWKKNFKNSLIPNHFTLPVNQFTRLLLKQKNQISHLQWTLRKLKKKKNS